MGIIVVPHITFFTHKKTPWNHHTLFNIDRDARFHSSIFELRARNKCSLACLVKKNELGARIMSIYWVECDRR